MTLIDFFVVAYYNTTSISSKKRESIKNMVSDDDTKKYKAARSEYDYMKENYGTDAVVDWIKTRLPKCYKNKFEQIYNINCSK